jgi:hypothetical protein
MLYEGYKRSASKHLKTCLSIIEAMDRLSLSGNTALITNSSKRPALHNIFYLSGYVLESISTYSLYKHYCWQTNRSVKIFDRTFSSISNFSFYRNHNYPYFAQGHNFQRNQFEVLKIPFNNSGIAFLDSSVNVTNDTEALFLNWKAEIRYHDFNYSYRTRTGSNIMITEQNIRDFLATTQKIYSDLLNIVG